MDDPLGRDSLVAPREKTSFIKLMTKKLTRNDELCIDLNLCYKFAAQNWHLIRVSLLNSNKQKKSFFSSEIKLKQNTIKTQKI